MARTALSKVAAAHERAISAQATCCWPRPLGSLRAGLRTSRISQGAQARARISDEREELQRARENLHQTIAEQLENEGLNHLIDGLIEARHKLAMWVVVAAFGLCVISIGLHIDVWAE